MPQKQVEEMETWYQNPTPNAPTCSKEGLLNGLCLDLPALGHSEKTVSYWAPRIYRKEINSLTLQHLPNGRKLWELFLVLEAP